MKIYDEITGEELISPNLNLGYLYDGKHVSGHVDETKIVLKGTVTDFRPEGLTHIVPGYDTYEDCQYYHKYTAGELNERSKLSLEEQVDAIAAQATYTAMMTDTLMTEK